MSSDWRDAADRLNQFVRQNRALGQQLASLGKEQARNEKLAFKLEEGRIYGMRQQYYDLILQRQLNREAAKPHTEPHW